jgi:hypothetical protein
VSDIRPEYLPVPVAARNQQSCLFETVQLDPDGIRRFVKLHLQVPQIRTRIAVEEKLQQQFKAGFVRY